MPKKRHLLMLWLCLVAGHGHAAAYHSLTAVQGAAEDLVRQQLPKDKLQHHVTADPLDDRLRLAVCTTPLQAFLPNGANLGTRTTVAVRCIGTAGWTVYVPVNIETETPTLVLIRALARNSAIGADDVEIRAQRQRGLGKATLQSITELAGQRLKRDLPAGTLLTANMLQPEIVIRRGQQVTLLASVAGIEVRSQGIALSDGSANSRIRVKNLNSAKVVEGMVDTENQVRVTL